MTVSISARHEANHGHEQNDDDQHGHDDQRDDDSGCDALLVAAIGAAVVAVTVTRWSAARCDTHAVIVAVVERGA